MLSSLRVYADDTAPSVPIKGLDAGRNLIQVARMTAYFFGYGSLVNRATHTYPSARVAQVAGWSRCWVGTGLRQVAYLSVVPDPGGQVAGLVAAVPGGDWAALDIRERAYRRHAVQAQFQTGADAVQMYVVDPVHTEDSAVHPILLSYLDTVIQGFLAEFGADGARAFFDTTRGWHLPILDDRSAPIYPRATALDKAERALVDKNLARVTSGRTPAP